MGVSTEEAGAGREGGWRQGPSLCSTFPRSRVVTQSLVFIRSRVFSRAHHVNRVLVRDVEGVVDVRLGALHVVGDAALADPWSVGESQEGRT